MKTRTYVTIVVLAVFAVGCEEAIPIGPDPIEIDVEVNTTVINDHDDHSGDKGDDDSDSQNRRPVLIIPPDQTNDAGDQVSLLVRCVDPDEDDTVTFSASGLPRGLQQDSGTGLISGEITSSSADSSPFSPSLTCSDGRASDSDVFRWIVNA